VTNRGEAEAYDRIALFREPFEKLAELPQLVLDGEIAVPDEQGITEIDRLSEALRPRGAARLAYFTSPSTRSTSTATICALVRSRTEGAAA
jgi:hypothetical protein